MKNFNEAIEEQFDSALITLYQRLYKEAGHFAKNLFWMMIREGSVGAVRLIINKAELTSTFQKLSRKKKLHLTVEALILKFEGSGLFSAMEIERCRKRLADYGYFVASPTNGVGLESITTIY